jgi:hypothetical protein
VWHHDVSPATLDLGALAFIMQGRPEWGSQRLANLTLPRGLTPFGRAVRIVTARVATHAGRGDWRNITGNSRMLGTEVAHTGRPGDPYTAWQRDMVPLLGAALADGIQREVLRAPTDQQPMLDAIKNTCGHKEWAKPLGRKVDPVGWDMPATRDGHQAAYDQGQEAPVELKLVRCPELSATAIYLVFGNTATWVPNRASLDGWLYVGATKSDWPRSLFDGLGRLNGPLANMPKPAAAGPGGPAVPYTFEGTATPAG